MENEYSEIQFVPLSVTQVIQTGKCRLRILILTASAADRDVSLYDGENSTNGDLKLVVSVKNGDTKYIDIPCGIQFQRGIYVSFSGNMQASIIGFIPE